jgi:glycosyltransferase involved in cell wall biosynthesis
VAAAPNHHAMKIYIDPKADVDYTAFYIQGLYDFFGKNRVFFSERCFKGLKPNRTLKIVVDDAQKSKKIVIDWGDDFSIDAQDYAWCDAYGKINFNREKTPEHYHPKVVRLAPSFGVKIWSAYESAFHGIRNMVTSRPGDLTVRRFLARYYRQYRQLPLKEYTFQKDTSNYIYSVNTLWNSDQWIDNDNTVNLYRANFMEVCKSLTNVNFEGGFVYSQIKNTNPRFKDLLIDREWVPKTTYIEKVKKSALVFNTPAWALCHGWKLGEYLALGKAILSTPLVNELPAPLEHGKHIHFVSGEVDEMRQAISLLLSDSEYRRYLEKNAYEYYQKYVSPEQSIRYFFEGKSK